LFFGRAATDSTRERVVHVGMWIGEGRYIHSSGRVRINSMDPQAEDFSEYNRNRYLRSKRLLGTEKGLALLKKDGLFSRIRLPEN
ncbi:MAG: glycoside hydrolase, partial [Calditrichaeota bacterium]|nr:glycoside hydrolase [Calditrichota bacterium]